MGARAIGRGQSTRRSAERDRPGAGNTKRGAGPPGRRTRAGASAGQRRGNGGQTPGHLPGIGGVPARHLISPVSPRNPSPLPNAALVRQTATPRSCGQHRPKHRHLAAQPVTSTVANVIRDRRRFCRQCQPSGLSPQGRTSKASSGAKEQAEPRREAAAGPPGRDGASGPTGRSSRRATGAKLQTDHRRKAADGPTGRNSERANGAKQRAASRVRPSRAKPPGGPTGRNSERPAGRDRAGRNLRAGQRGEGASGPKRRNGEKASGVEQRPGQRGDLSRASLQAGGPRGAGTAATAGGC